MVAGTFERSLPLELASTDAFHFRGRIDAREGQWHPVCFEVRARGRCWPQFD